MKYVFTVLSLPTFSAIMSNKLSRFGIGYLCYTSYCIILCSSSRQMIVTGDPESIMKHDFVRFISPFIMKRGGPLPSMPSTFCSSFVFLSSIQFTRGGGCFCCFFLGTSTNSTETTCHATFVLLDTPVSGPS